MGPVGSVACLACGVASGRAKGQRRHRGRDAHAVSVGSISGYRRQHVAGSGQCRTGGTLCVDAAGRDGGAGTHGVADGGNVMALSPAVFLDKDGTVLADRPYNVDPARMVYAPT